MFIALGVLFTVSAAGRPMGALAQPGADIVPLLLSVTMAILGAVILFKSLTIETEGGDPIGAIAWRPLLAIVGAIAVFGACIDRLGLVLATLLLVAIASLAGELRKGVGVLLNIAVLTLLAWLIVAHSLKLAMPIWPHFAAS
jgi:Tripartite tricarboxylate transporter TctB family